MQRHLGVSIKHKTHLSHPKSMSAQEDQVGLQHGNEDKLQGHGDGETVPIGDRALAQREGLPRGGRIC